ncbi:sialidase family protein [Cyclobacterium jeungdonense]|uniref:Sialidase family protein n=1 Tax=Cyclobacterium jeungdonense TaxID=708087 RepID=A0ABT8C435_9BACT|nr:sialidase family protein [Cyclobacterium jeungdonense]MDN3687066.1 sialidase family protein [Cyclobacterium jeungdonense]
MQKTWGLLIHVLFVFTPFGNNPLELFNNGEWEARGGSIQQPLYYPYLCNSKTGPISFPVKIDKSPTNEAVVINDGGTLKIFYINRPGNADSVMVLRKTKTGWGEPEGAFQLPGQAYYALQVVKSENENLVCVFHLFGEGDQGYRGRHLDLWVNRRVNNKWGTPFKILEGYVGSIRGLQKLKSGRLLLSVGKAVTEREAKPSKNEIDFGWNSIHTMYSDDGGASWVSSSDELKIEIDNSKVTRYGAIEPEIIERQDGSVWMLIRTTHGRLYQSISWDQGETWADPEATEFISSDSPACLLRLKDGRMVIFWNSCQRWDNPQSYAIGGREVLHAAISSDDGLSWEGFREVAQSPELETSQGDRGTAYPSAEEMENGNILLVTGQGKGKGIYEIDPNWLEAKTQNFVINDFGDLNQVNGTQVQGVEQLVFGVHYPKLNSTGEWVTNFPMATEGILKVEIFPGKDFESVTFALTDHFSISADSMASCHAVFSYKVQKSEIEHHLSGNSDLKFELKWRLGNSGESKLEVSVNNRTIGIIKMRRYPEIGLNYLRIGMQAAGSTRPRVRSIAFEKNNE